LNRKEILSFITNNPVCHIATSKDNIPSVRIMRILQAKEEGILFNTKRFKDSCKDLCVN